ncbi:formiminotransferase-cyclodeaminase [Ktedonobacteria bacterium brp13]|nr:formiminotransferase-cyclodeaminase [Ktedonobacteria bacterium brp13]
MYLDKPLQVYLDDLASAQPTPGGGSTAAVCGAMAAALTAMVSRLTLSKADYAPVHAEIQAVLERAEQIRARFQQLIQEDIDAYGQLSASFKLSRATADEKAARTTAVQAALLTAALVPLAVVELAAELAHLSLRVAEIGNKNVLSDIATAAGLESCAGSGASQMVRVNLHSLKDAERVSELERRLDTALTTLAQLSEQTVNTVGGQA